MGDVNHVIGHDNSIQEYTEQYTSLNKSFFLPTYLRKKSNEASCPPGPKIPSRVMLENVETPMLLPRCRLRLQQRKVDLGVG